LIVVMAQAQSPRMIGGPMAGTSGKAPTVMFFTTVRVAVSITAIWLKAFNAVTYAFEPSGMMATPQAAYVPGMIVATLFVAVSMT
jgi:hypothetical protein